MNTLLLLHGAIGAKDQMAPLAESLSSEFQVESFDFSGHGDCPMPDPPFSIELFAEDTLRWMKENQKEQVDIFGYSMGGYVALYLASIHPEKVGKIFTLSTKFDWNPENAAKETAMLNPQKIKDKVPKFAQILSNRHGDKDWETNLSKTSEMMISLAENPLLSDDQFANILHSVMISTGDRDRTATPEENLQTFQKLQNGQLLILPHTPHPIERAPLELLRHEAIHFFKQN